MVLDDAARFLPLGIRAPIASCLPLPTVTHHRRRVPHSTGEARAPETDKSLTPELPDPTRVVVHLVDGTYELFRHFYGLRRAGEKVAADKPMGAVAGVLGTVVQMLEQGATHIGVATDHVIESFRNDLWPGYKTGEGIDSALWAQFHPLEEALAAMGVATWAMVELEADDALASAAHLAALDERVEKVCIWTPDKDLAQCVVGTRVVQMDRRSGQIRDADAVRAKFGVAPENVPDYLALVGGFGGRLSGSPRLGAEDRGATDRAVRTARRVSSGGTRRQTRAGAALQVARDPAHRCTPFRERGRASVARTEIGIRRSRRTNRRSAVAGAAGQARGFVTRLPRLRRSGWRRVTTPARE